MDIIKSGQFIKEKRTEKNMTQKELAQKLNCTDKAISRWETGTGFPDVSFLIPLSEALDVSVNEIIIGETIEKEQIAQKADETIVETLTASNKQKNIFNMILFELFVVVQAFVFFVPAFIGGSGDKASVLFVDFLVVILCSVALGFMNMKMSLKFIMVPISVAMFVPSTFLISDESLFLFTLPFSARIAFVAAVMILIAEGAKILLKKLYEYKQKLISYHFPPKLRKVLIVLTAIVLALSVAFVAFVAMEMFVGVRFYKFTSDIDKYEEYLGEVADVKNRRPDESKILIQNAPTIEQLGEYTDVTICKKTLVQLIFGSDSLTAFFEYDEDNYAAQKEKILQTNRFVDRFTTNNSEELQDVQAHVYGFDFYVVDLGESVDMVKEQYLIGFNDEKHTVVYAHKYDPDLDYVDSLDDDLVYYYAFPIEYR